MNVCIGICLSNLGEDFVFWLQFRKSQMHPLQHINKNGCGSTIFWTGIKIEDMARKMLCFGANGVYYFVGSQNSVAFTCSKNLHCS